MEKQSPIISDFHHAANAFCRAVKQNLVHIIDLAAMIEILEVRHVMLRQKAQNCQNHFSHFRHKRKDVKQLTTFDPSEFLVLLEMRNTFANYLRIIQISQSHIYYAYLRKLESHLYKLINLSESKLFISCNSKLFHNIDD